MKNLMKLFWVLLAFLLTISVTNAQNEQYKFTGTINQGNSFMGIFFRTAGVSKYVSSYSKPAFQASFDYGIKKWVSAGLAVSYQKMGFTISDYEIKTQWDTISQDVVIDLSRLNISGRALFHYGNKGRIDMYSGIRLGYHRYAISYNTTEILFDILSDYEEFDRIVKLLRIKPEDIWNPIVRNKFGYQLVLFGFRAYIAENVGLNAELALGKPHFCSAGITYRF